MVGSGNISILQNKQDKKMEHEMEIGLCNGYVNDLSVAESEGKKNIMEPIMLFGGLSPKP